MIYKVMPKRMSHQIYQKKCLSIFHLLLICLIQCKHGSIGLNMKFLIATAQELFNYSELLLQRLLKRLDADLLEYFFMILIAPDNSDLREIFSITEFLSFKLKKNLDQCEGFVGN